MSVNPYEDTLRQVLATGAPAIIPAPPEGDEYDRLPQEGGAEAPAASSRPNPYRDTLDEEARSRELVLRRSLVLAGETNPDHHAEILELARRTGLPPELIGRNFEKIRRQATISDTPYAQMVREAPALTAWLSEPNTAAVAHDDLVALTGLERVLRFGEHSVRALGAGALRFSTGAYGVAEGVSEALGLEGLGAYFRDLGEHPRNLSATVRGDQAGAGFVERSVYGGIESIGLTAATLPLALMGGGAPAMLGGMGAATGGESYSEARRQGVTVPNALMFGLSQGAIEVATERIPAVRLLEDVAKHTGFVRALVRQGVAEVPGEQAATLLQDLNAWAVLPENVERTFGDYLWERPSAAAETLIATIVAVGGQTAVARGLDRAINGSSPTQRTLEAIGQAATDSKTRGRSPAKFAEFVQQATEGGPLATVYLPVRSFVEYFQSKDEDPAGMAARLTGDPQAFARAVETGADLAVPMAAYASTIAPTAHNRFFSQEARFAPDQPNAREEAALEQAAGTAIAAAVEEASTSAPAAAIGESVREQLEAAGFEPGVARTNAALVESVFATLGVRTGVDAVAAFESYRLSVSRSGLAQSRAARPRVPEQAYQTLFEAAVADARTSGFSGDMESLRPAFDAALGQAAVLVGEIEAAGQAYSPQGLMQAIARAGGIGQDEIHAGEIGRLWESSTGWVPGQGVTKSGRVRRGRHRATGGMLGVTGVLRQKGGKRLDAMAEALRQEPGFDHLESPRDVLEAIDAALGATPDARSLADALAQVGVTPGALWWQREFGAPGKRGAIRFDPTGAVQIELFAGANLSTFVHEGAHFFLEAFADAADSLTTADVDTLTDSQRRVLADYGALLEWLGVENRADITTEQHEQFARGFEAYVMEGRAPAVELRAVFARVRAWMVSLYRSLRRLRVNLTPEVRGVFDRLVATDEAIAAAARDTGALAPLLTDELAAAVGLSAEERAAYSATIAAAMAQAQEQVQGRLMAELRREREGWFLEERAAVRTEQAMRVAEQPVYKALALLQHGLDAEGLPLPEGVAFKLDRAQLVASFGADVLAKLPRPLVVADDGLAPAIAAELLGYDSAPALVDALTTAQPFEAAVEAATDREMRRRHGDLRRDGTLEEDATRAVLDAGAEVFAAEARMLEALAVQQGTAPLAPTAPIGTLRAIAERRIRGTAVGALRPGTFAAAAKRAGQRALELAARRDFAGALGAKQQQLLNAELHRAASEVRDLVETTRARFRRVWGRDDALAKTHNMDLVHAARALLVQFGFAQHQPGVEGVWTYLEQVRTYDPETYADLEAAIDAAGAAAQPYRTLTVEAFAGVRDAIENVLHLARRSRQIVIDGKAEELDAVRAQLELRLLEVSTPAARPGYDRAATAWEKTKRGLLGVRAMLRRVESWVDAVDSEDPRGVFRRVLFTPISEAAARYREAKKTTLHRYLGIVKGVEKGLTTDAIPAPELGYTFGGKVELLHAILHTGNASNRSKLLRGREWGLEQEDGSVDSSRWDGFVRRLWAQGVLTKADYDFVQGVWDLLDGLKPEAQRVHHALYGFYFNEVTAEPLQTPFGTYAGGYVPAMVDPFIDDGAAARSDREAVEQTPNSFMFPSTGRGFTKKRIEIYARPLALNLALIPMHIDRVLRFVHLQAPVKDAGRLLINPKLRASLGRFDPTVVGDLLMPWLQRTAQQLIEQPAKGDGGRYIARVARTLRTRTGLNIMAGNVVNTVQQVTGLSLSALKVPQLALARSLWGYLRAPGQTADEIAEKSVWMRTRVSTQVIEVQQHIDDLLINPNQYEQARRFAQKHGYFLQAGAQNIVDVITWRAAYDVAVGEGATEPEAVRQADAAVRLTQGSFNPEDLSNFETGTAAMRLFTMFHSWFNMVANVNATRFEVVVRDLGVRKGAGRLLYLYTYGFMLPAVVSELIVQGLGGELGDDDDEGLLAELLDVFFGGQVRTATAFVPWAGPAVLAGVNAWNSKFYDDRISTSPAVSAIEGAVRSPHSVYKAIEEGRVTKRAVRDVLTVVALLTGIPTMAAARPLGYLADVASGDEEPENPADAARGLVVGR